MKKLLITTAVVLTVATPTLAATRQADPNHPTEHWVAPGVWQMGDVGRNHGVITSPGIPKCNPWVSPECARLHPSLFKKVPQPR